LYKSTINKPPFSAKQDVIQKRLGRKPFKPHKIVDTSWNNRTRIAPKELNPAENKMINSIIDKQR